MNRALLGVGIMFAVMVGSFILGLIAPAPGLVMASLLCLWPGLLFALGRVSTQYRFARREDTTVMTTSITPRRRPAPENFG